MNGSGYQRRTSYRLLLVILWATILVFVIELTVGWAAQSLCLLADSVHTLIDAFGALLSLVAVASPQRTLGKEIWGHGRAEAAGALILSAILGFSGISLSGIALAQLNEAFFQSASNIFPASLTVPMVLLIWLLKLLWLAVVWVSAHKSKQLQSLALKLNNQHILAEAWLTGLLLIVLCAIAQGYRWLDPLLCLVLVAMAVKSLWQMLHRQLPMLLQPTAIAPEAIAQIACQIEGVTRCTRILSRGMVGRQVWVELHLALHPEFMILANSIGDRVERSLRDHYGPVRTQIWLDQTRPDLSNNPDNGPSQPSLGRYDFPYPSDPIGPK
jgi:cation diffusion facilitator family transporter